MKERSFSKVVLNDGHEIPVWTVKDPILKNLKIGAGLKCADFSKKDQENYSFEGIYLCVESPASTAFLRLNNGKWKQSQEKIEILLDHIELPDAVDCLEELLNCLKSQL